MGGKTEQISIRADQKLLKRIDAVLARGDYASISDLGYQAILKLLEREEYEKELRDLVINLLTLDELVAEKLKSRIWEVLATSLTPLKKEGVDLTPDRRI